MTQALVGSSVRKHDGDLYLTGRAVYAADIALPGMVHAVLVRSPHPHARILEIDLMAARRRPGVCAVLTGEEACALADPVPHGLDPAKLGGNHAEIRCLAVDNVVYAGQPVAAVVAATRGDAVAAAREVAVRYEPLPFVLDAEDALAESAPLLYEGWDSNLVIAGGAGADDFDEVAREADHVLSDELRMQRGTSAPIETRCYLADWNAREQQLTFIGTTQNPHPLRWTLAAALRLSEAQIRVVAPRTGGSFGLKVYGHPEEVLTCVLARLVGVPVRWLEDRADCMLAGAREQIHRFEVAFDDDGRIRAMRDRALSDVGAAAPGPAGGWHSSTR